MMMMIWKPFEGIVRVGEKIIKKKKQINCYQLNSGKLENNLKAPIRLDKSLNPP